MDDFGILGRDLGFRPQGKSAPMSASKSSGISTGTVNVGIGSIGSARSSSVSGKSPWNSTPSSASVLRDDVGFFGSSQSQNRPDYGGMSGYDDVFGGPPRYSNPSVGRAPPPSSASPLDSLFQGTKDSSKASTLPVYDKPVYDDDIFDGVPGIKSSASINYDDVFSSMSSQPKSASQYDDLLGNFGRAETESKDSSGRRSGGKEKEVHGFDELIPGFGGSSPPKRNTSETNRPNHSAIPPTKPSSNVMDDPFVTLESTSVPAYSSSGLFIDPLEHFNKPSNSGSTKADGSSVSGVFDNIDAFDGITKSVPSFSSEVNRDEKNKSPLRAGSNLSPSHIMSGNGPTVKTSMNNFENVVHKKMPADDYRESHQTLFDIPTGSSNSNKSTGRNSSRPKDVNANSYEANSQDVSPKSEGNLETADDGWLIVSEVPLFTQPTSAPPPSRPPPSLDIKPGSIPKADTSYSTGLNANRKVNVADSVKSVGVSSIDELEDFAMGKPQTYADELADVLSRKEKRDTNSAAAASAAAMQEAMDRAEAKFKHAREVRERERDAKAGKNRESAQQEDEKARKDAQEGQDKEKQEKLEQREREEKEKEQKRLEKERDREREEREKARQAVERATKEARDRAVAEARLRAERVSVEKANAEAQGRAERAAVQRAAAEARERAVAEVREREAAAAREKQKNENDLESFFGMGARPNSAPRQRSTTSDPAFDAQFQSKGSSDGARRTSVGTSSSMRKASSATNIVDDLASMFGGAATSAGVFQEVEGENEERRRARLERHQRTLERAQKALAEKNDRDMQTQREQAERHRIAETLDIEIKRWSAGKEGNLRALLSTLQYVLWPECGWQPVSLTDLITGASVKKVYRKATLCIHPDKVQQKGANIQQKYVAEKVFDLLKEAWNKFNSEELF